MKDEAKFTRGPAPGPWTTLPSVWDKADTCIMAADGLAVAHVIFPADVPMIAAARELYEALEGLLATHKQGRGQCCEAADRAIDALAKARGEA